jgi:hypothetical protein
MKRLERLLGERAMASGRAIDGEHGELRLHRGQ